MNKNELLRTITAPAGIGDNIWLFQKLINCGERFDFIIPDGAPQRGHQIFEMMPAIANSVQYAPELGYKKINKLNDGKKTFSSIKKKNFFLSANEHLENGKRIEDFLPDLKTVYKLDYNTTASDVLNAEKLTPLFNRTGVLRHVGIYTSAYSNARNWNGWDATQWFTLLRLLYKNNLNMKFVLIGAPYDVGITVDLLKALDEYNIPYVNTIGEPLPVVVEMLKRLEYFIGFPSGLSILNETLGMDGCMFYPPHLKAMINTWAEPKRIAENNYKGCLFCEPADLYLWLKDKYCFYEKIVH